MLFKNQKANALGLLAQVYNLTGLTSLNSQTLKTHVDLFWKDIFKEINDKDPDTHLLVIVRVKFEDVNVGYRSIADMRRVNFTDREEFKKYLVHRLGLLTDSYQTDPVTEIIFSYKVVKGQAPDTKITFVHKESQYNLKKHSFNNIPIPLTMKPEEFGEVLTEQKMENLP